MHRKGITGVLLPVVHRWQGLFYDAIVQLFLYNQRRKCLIRCVMISRTEAGHLHCTHASTRAIVAVFLFSREGKCIRAITRPSSVIFQELTRCENDDAPKKRQTQGDNEPSALRGQFAHHDVGRRMRSTRRCTTPACGRQCGCPPSARMDGFVEPASECDLPVEARVAHGGKGPPR